MLLYDCPSGMKSFTPASELLFPVDAIDVLLQIEIICVDLSTLGDRGVSQTLPDLDQDFNGGRFGHSLVRVPVAFQLEPAPKSPLHGSEDCPVQRLEIVRVTGRNEPKSDPETCREGSDL
jgi:hypothetical protein